MENLKKTKEKQGKNIRKKVEGITLIALVITIIVLLILAGVSIAMLTGENGILKRANEAKEETEISTEDEQRKMAMIEASTNTENTKFQEVTIPAGFAPTRIDGESTVNEGLVITDEQGNEFVWVPVDDINKIAQCKMTEGKCNLKINEENGELKCITEGHEATADFFVGKLYAIEIMENFGIPNNKYSESSGLREPALVQGGDRFDLNTSMEYYKKAGFNSSSLMLEGLKQEYKKMIESVNKYKGFFVGRYETSFSDASKDSAGYSGVVQSKFGVIPISSNNTINNMWYGLYELEKKYNVQQNSIQSSMIWGSQYDAMLNWMLSGKNGAKITEISKSQENIRTTGENPNDVINNIYDLGNNLIEWTLEAYGDNGRVVRGGSFHNVHSPSFRSYCSPTDSKEWIGSRLALYIK